MKIYSPRCDVHKTSELALAETFTLSPLGDRNIMRTFACTVEGCTRHYHPKIFGYHNLAIGEYPKVGDYRTKPVCGMGHHTEFMILTEVNGLLTWACPHESCNRTAALDESSLTAEVIQDILNRHEYMWFRKGPIAIGGDVIGWAKIQGPEPGQQIWINNYGLPERPDFRAMVYEDDELACHNWHFKTPQECLRQTWGFCLRWNRVPQLRFFEWYEGHYAYTLDGLIDTEVIIVEMAPGSGDWRMRIKEKDGRVYWLHDPRWSKPIDALTL